ncbi:sulfatase-like hydrolase/transferase (plasmid) [Halorussus salilacus]|uniref:sulfatase-like hydrolase/transferase n=1 Tax=Halorussus salilacus TaxID=2953750 RepID=UPI0020A07F7E|nr:sulfatase-like hydrolase/transferase [Halorussus salilacus]USZ69923.1 sulfatase-like hydrolase/transferase [Halorussus salilacus]
MRNRDPNVVLLLTDQERYDVSAPDGPDVRTPNMDRLQEEGMRFTKAYTPISICTSARGSLLSGLYPHNHGMLNNCHEPDAVRLNFPEEIPTFGELLADAGYDNSYAGKWHVGRDQRPADFGFEYLGGGDGGHDDEDADFREYQRELGVDPEEAELEETIYTDNPDPELIAAKTTMPKEATRTYYLAERTVERIRDGESLDEPFFHRTDFVGPHHPYTVPDPYASMYDPDDIEPWGSFDETYEGKPAVHENYLEYRGVDGLDWDDWAEAVAKYFGFVTFIDDQIGRILDALDESGLADDTAVFHAADHGDFTGSHRQFNKGPMMYEQTYHVPLMVRWPGEIDPGTTCEEFVRLLDLMPTFLELGGVEPPEDIDGRSVLPLLCGEVPDDWPETLFAEYHGDEFGLYSQRMVRTDRYKYVYNAPDRDELYDLREDPHELHNLADHPEYRDLRADLEETMVEWMAETDDVILKWSRKVLGE